MKKHLFLILKIVISLTIFSTVIYFFDIRIIDAITKIEKYYFIVLAMLIPVIVNPIISNNRWKLFLSVQGIKEKFFTLLKISYVSIFLGILLPATSGSDAIRIYYIEKRNKHISGAGTASVFMERLLGFIILTFLGLIGSFLSTLFYGLDNYFFIVILILHLLLLLVYFISKNKKLYLIISSFFEIFNKKKSNKLIKFINSSYYDIINFKFNNTLAISVLLIMLLQLCSIVSVFLIFKSFNINIPFYYHLAFVPIIQIISIIPISISGFGLRESGFIYFYGLLGIDNGISLMVSLIYYAIFILVPAFIGMFIYITDTSYKKVKYEIQK